MSNKYQREIKPGVFVDVYDVLQAWRVTNPALQHLVKKALAPGQRGHKTRDEDLRDIEASARRAIELQADRIEIDMPAMDELAGEPVHTCWLPMNPNALLSDLPILVLEHAAAPFERPDTIRVPCDADGWVEWPEQGGIMPVPRDEMLDAVIFDGRMDSDHAEFMVWAGPPLNPLRVTRFRLAKQEQPE